MKNPTHILHATGFRLCIDWIKSDSYKDRVRYETFREASKLWQKIKYDRKHSGRLDYEEDELLLIESIKYAAEQGWIIREFSKMGRPRTKNYSVAEQMKAEMAANQHLAESTLKRLRSVAGEYQTESYAVLTVTDNLFKEYVQGIEPAHITDKTRDELLVLTGFNPKVNNKLWKWLKANGWEEKRVQRNQKDGEVYRVRTLYQADVQF